jgi:hypothetical protein
MVSLILVVCLAATPDVCREERPPMEPVSQISCIVEGQQFASQWLEEHPKWALKGWRCNAGAPGKAA